MRKTSPAFAVFALAAVLPSGSAAQNPGCFKGNSAAPVKIEVFSDYQCPACRDFYLGTMRRVFTDYADAGKACVVYREFPLDIHPHARTAARYGHAALRLGLRQWALVTDALFSSQDEWARSGNVETVVAKALGAQDLAALRKHLQDPSLDAAVNADIQLGFERGVNSTPTFFITSRGSTEKVAGVVNFPILKRYLDHLLEQ